MGRIHGVPGGARHLHRETQGRRPGVQREARGQKRLELGRDHGRYPGTGEAPGRAPRRDQPLLRYDQPVGMDAQAAL